MNPWLRWPLIVATTPVWVTVLVFFVVLVVVLTAALAVVDVAEAVVDNRPVDWRAVRSVWSG